MHYLISCSIAGNVRQSVSIKFEDLKLPSGVIDTLKENGSVSMRPNLSLALKSELQELRTMQRELYDYYCINYDETHFITPNYFSEANTLIKDIQKAAADANAKLSELWQLEYSKWVSTTEAILLPIFSETSEEYCLARDAYLSIFPTKKEYQNAIKVVVVGPLPVSLDRVSEPVGNIEELMLHENNINTNRVLESAKESAADKALGIAAEMLDMLDSKTVSEINSRHVGDGHGKYGSWHKTADKLQLISDSVPGFDNLARLAEDLINAGSSLKVADKAVSRQAQQDYYNVKNKIRDELERIVSTRDSSEGLQSLKKSLAFSNQYKDLMERIKQVDSTSDLQAMRSEVDLHVAEYEQRVKQLNKLMSQKAEVILCNAERGVDF